MYRTYKYKDIRAYLYILARSNHGPQASPPMPSSSEPVAEADWAGVHTTEFPSRLLDPLETGQGGSEAKRVRAAV